MNGIYSMTYRGAVDWGIGMLVLQNGVVTGADIAGALYDGGYTESPTDLFLTMNMHVPAGVQLAQGGPPRANAYDVPFSATIPKRAIESSTPVLVELPPGPVNVIIKQIRSLESRR